jgi:hypothetical protein
MEVEDCGADFTDCSIELIDRGVQYGSNGVLVAWTLQHPLQTQPGGEQLLDDVVMEIPRDSVAIFEDVDQSFFPLLFCEFDSDRSDVCHRRQLLDLVHSPRAVAAA